MIKLRQILLFFSFSLIAIFANCQDGKEDIREFTKKADSYFDNSNYSNALKLYLKIDSIQSFNSEINYKIGACYLNSRYEKIKALPYLEYAIHDKRLQFPIVVYKDLGMLFHMDYQFNKSIEYFQLYLNSAGKKDKYVLYARRMIEICKNAIEITTKSYDLGIENIGYPISTKNNEFSPLISADESIMFFMRIEKSAENWKIGRFETQTEAKIMFSYNTSGQWEVPKEVVIDLPSSNYVALAGLAPDGEQIFLQIGEGKKADLYNGYFVDGKITDITKLDNSINSKHWEGRISLSPDGFTLYFSSDRPSGYGGKDLYKTEKNERGLWDKAVNLGKAINTRYDEEAPFIHPDNKTLYFSSQGHNTIGGYDIFKSESSKNSWSKPENIGFPNSTKDDIYFVVSANGESGYFSTFQNSLLDNHHIYRVNLKGSIPLTLVKGTILAGNPLKPIGANIRVIDKTTNSRTKYIYNPNPKTGKYLMIFPPRKNYDMIIEAENYKPQLVNIYIPNQTYFYELFQEIHLSPIESLGKIIGEEISVNNTFYDIYATSLADSLLKEQSADSIKDYGQLLQIVEDLINTTDSLGIDLLEKQYTRSTEQQSNRAKENMDLLFNMIEKAIETTDSVSLSILDENTLFNEESNKTYFYANNEDDNNLEQYVIEGDTILTVPSISTSSNDKKSSFFMSRDNLANKNISVQKDSVQKDLKENISLKYTKAENRKIILKERIYFNQNEAIILNKSFNKLNQISELIINNQWIGVEISGFTDSKGENDYNLVLSRQRANNVLQYLFKKGINTQKAIVKAYGEIKSQEEASDEDRMKNRRVEIRVFEVINVEGIDRK